MRKFVLGCCLYVLLLALVSCPALADNGYRLLVATDPHFIAPGLTDHGVYFKALTEHADGKLMQRIKETCLRAQR